MPIALIVGGGMAGRAAAVTLRRIGYQGEIVLVGEPVPVRDLIDAYHAGARERALARAAGRS